ncbi:MAG: hypothetical protein CVU16_06765 [Betaproteobacteria bacterium HGW-Betaproteobacteria-10]|nr:MAG: hypothetical protein CVU16_06765 [Betaproteobacteria bacterium HGW-Betaproteobacteria-10]
MNRKNLQLRQYKMKSSLVGKLHLDLSSTSCEDALGAISTDQPGFGVVWGVRFLKDWLNNDRRPSKKAPQT